MRVKDLNVGVLWPIGLVMLMIDSSVQQQRSRKQSRKGRVNMYVECNPKNLCEFSPCHNGGSCEPISNSDRTPGFRCRCGSGFDGEICLDSKYRSFFRTLAANSIKRGKLLTSTTVRWPTSITAKISCRYRKLEKKKNVDNYFR